MAFHYKWEDHFEGRLLVCFSLFLRCKYRSARCAAVIRAFLFFKRAFFAFHFLSRGTLRTTKSSVSTSRFCGPLHSLFYPVSIRKSELSSKSFNGILSLDSHIFFCSSFLTLSRSFSFSVNTISVKVNRVAHNLADLLKILGEHSWRYSDSPLF